MEFYIATNVAYELLPALYRELNYGKFTKHSIRSRILFYFRLYRRVNNYIFSEKEVSQSTVSSASSRAARLPSDG
jgi:hypothetical protein